MNSFDDVLHVIIISNSIWSTHFSAEARVLRALFIPHILICPLVDHLEPLHEENTKVLRLIISAAVNGRNDASHDLSENMEHADLGYFEVK